MQWTALELLFGGGGAEGGVGGASAVFFDFSAARVGGARKRSDTAASGYPGRENSADSGPSSAKGVRKNLSRFLAVMRGLKTPRLKASELQLSTPAETLKRSQLTELWRRRHISNFEYLMRLNTLAGWVVREGNLCGFKGELIAGISRHHYRLCARRTHI